MRWNIKPCDDLKLNQGKIRSLSYSCRPICIQYGNLNTQSLGDIECFVPKHVSLCLCVRKRESVCVLGTFKPPFISKVIWFYFSFVCFSCLCDWGQCHQFRLFIVILKFVYTEFMNIRYSLLLWFKHSMIIIIMTIIIIIIPLIICPSKSYYCYDDDDDDDDLKCNTSLCVFVCVNIQ